MNVVSLLVAVSHSKVMDKVACPVSTPENVVVDDDAVGGKYKVASSIGEDSCNNSLFGGATIVPGST